MEFQEGDIFGVHIPDVNNSQFWLYEQTDSRPLDLCIDFNLDSPTPSTTLITLDLTTMTYNKFSLVTVLNKFYCVPLVTLIFIIYSNSNSNIKKIIYYQLLIITI